MGSILYRIIFPGLVVSIIFALLAFFDYRVYKKRKMQGKQTLTKKWKIVIFIAIALFGLFLSGFYTLDLILQDYVTQQGVYNKTYRGREVYIQELYFISGDHLEHCTAFAFDHKVQNLEIGENYKFTFAKRTGMLIAIEKSL